MQPDLKQVIRKRMLTSTSRVVVGFIYQHINIILHCIVTSSATAVFATVWWHRGNNAANYFLFSSANVQHTFPSSCQIWTCPLFLRHRCSTFWRSFLCLYLLRWHSHRLVNFLSFSSTLASFILFRRQTTRILQTPSSPQESVILATFFWTRLTATPPSPAALLLWWILRLRSPQATQTHHHRSLNPLWPICAAVLPPTRVPHPPFAKISRNFMLHAPSSWPPILSLRFELFMRSSTHFFLSKQPFAQRMALAIFVWPRPLWPLANSMRTLTVLSHVETKPA